MKKPAISINFFFFFIGSYLLSLFYIGGSTFSLAAMPPIFYTLSGSSIAGSVMIFLVYLMSGVYKGMPDLIIARVLISLSLALGVFLFGYIRTRNNNMNLATVAVTVLPSILTFLIMNSFYPNEQAYAMARTILVTMAINTAIAIIIHKVINMPDQKGVFAEWLKSRR